jgi:hypothetical protein
MLLLNPTHLMPLYTIGDLVEIVGGKYAGLGGTVIALYDGGCEVNVGGYRLPVAEADLAPEVLTVAREALRFLETLPDRDTNPTLARLLIRLDAALRYLTRETTYER